MELVLSLDKNIEQNAGAYFDKAKKLKKKIPGIRRTIDDNKRKLDTLSINAAAQKASVQDKIIKKKQWFEKFRWFMSSDDFLVIGGRDATTNEIVIKKYTEDHDIIFHTDLPGSPFVVIKNPDDKPIPESTIIEAAEFCASFSRSWKSGRGNAEVFHVNPDQVSKVAKSGEYIAKGAFMIYGDRKYHNISLNLAIGVYDGSIMCAPLSAVKKHCKVFVEIIPGNAKLSDVAKKIQKIIGGVLDEIIRALPSECDVKKMRR